MALCVVDVGNCPPDHSGIRRLVLRNFDAQVVQAHGWSDARSAVVDQGAHLVIVNRILDHDGSEGLDIIRQLKADPHTRHVPVMLLSNYAEYQWQAERLGAMPGFGKAQLAETETVKRLGRALAAVVQDATEPPRNSP